MNRLLLVDGMNLHFQMFFGMPSRIVNKDGIAIQGVIGFVGALGKLIKLCATEFEEKADYIRAEVTKICEKYPIYE